MHIFIEGDGSKSLGGESPIPWICTPGCLNVVIKIID